MGVLLGAWPASVCVGGTSACMANGQQLPPNCQTPNHTNMLVYNPNTHRCIDALRQLETAEGWSHPAVGLLALQAFFATGNTQQVEVEAAGVCD